MSEYDINSQNNEYHTKSDERDPFTRVKNNQRSLDGMATFVRINKLMAGIVITSIAIGLTIWGLWMSRCDTFAPLIFNTTQATVLTVENTKKVSEIKIKWEFNVSGTAYTGEAQAEKNYSYDKELYRQISECKPGDKIKISYVPDNPADSRVYKPYIPSTLYMMLFNVVFIIAGCMALIISLSQKIEKKLERTFGPVIVTAILLCMPASFLFNFLGNKFPTKIILPIFLVYTIIIVPVVLITTGKIAGKRKTQS